MCREEEARTTTTTTRRRTTRSKCCFSRASLELWHLKKKKRDQGDTTLWCWVAVVLCVFFLEGHEGSCVPSIILLPL